MQIVLKAVGIFLIVLTVWMILAPVDPANAADGVARLMWVLISPLTIGTGLFLMRLGSSSDKINPPDATQKASFNSKKVSLTRVIFVIGFIIFGFLTFWVAAFFINNLSF